LVSVHVIPRPHEQLMRILPAMQPSSNAPKGGAGGGKNPD
jgi:microcompartment protein CcmL/EutN